MMRVQRAVATGMIGLLAFFMHRAAAHSQDLKSLDPRDGLLCLLVNKNSGRCLSIAGRSAEPGARIVQGPMPEEAGLTERWKLIASGQAFRLRNEHSGLVLEIGSANPNRGVQAIQWHDHETRTNQHWTFELVDDFYLIRPGHADFVLGISQGKMQDGARAIQWDYVRDVPDQLWELRSSDPVAAPQMPAPPVVDAPKTVATSTLLVAGLLGGVVLIVVIFALVGVVYWRRSRPVSHPSTENDAPKQASTSISLTCPGCQRILKPSATSVGKKVRCSKCGVAVLVPASAGSQ